jgi:WD40 repeat protein
MQRRCSVSRSGSSVTFGRLLCLALFGFGFASAAWSQEAVGPRLQIQLGHGSAVFAVAVTPDGKTAVSGSFDGIIKIWELATGRELRSLPRHGTTVTSIAVTPDGKYAISGSYDKTLRIWDLATGRAIRNLAGHGGFIKAVAVSPDGKTALSASEDKTLRYWDLTTGTLIRTLADHADYVTSAAFLPDGRTALSGSYDRTLKLWDLASGKVLRTMTSTSARVSAIAVSPDGSRALSGSLDAGIKLWDLSTGREIMSFADNRGQVQSVAFSPDGTTALSGSGKGSLSLWDLASGRELRTFMGHGDAVNSVVYTPDGKSALSGSDDRTLRLWDLGSGKEIRSFRGYGNHVDAVAFTPDGKSALSGSSGGTFKLWDLASGRDLRTFSGPKGGITALRVSADGKLALSGSADTTLKLWDLATGKEIRTFSGHGSPVSSVAISPDGKVGISGSYDGTARLWNLATGAAIATLTGHGDGPFPGSKAVFSVAFSPDGTQVLSGAWDKTLRLWDASTGRAIRSFAGHLDAVCSVAFARDGKTAVSGSWDKTIRVWDLATGREIRKLTGSPAPFISVAVSPDCRSALWTADDWSLRLWDLDSGRESKILTGADATSFAVAFSPDGRTALSGDMALRFWDVASGSLLYSTVSTPTGDWLAWTPEGFFAGTEWATRNLVHIVDGMKTIGIDQVYDVYYRPDLVAAKAAGKDISAYAAGLDLASLLKAGGLPPLVEITSPTAGSSAGREVSLRIRVTDQGGGIGKITLFNGDSPVVISDASGRGLKVVASGAAAARAGAVYEYEALLTLRGGMNALSASAYNKNNNIESRRAAISLQYGSSVVVKPALYILTVAVQRYRDQALRLKYTVDDAKALAEALRTKSGSLYRSASVYPLYDEAVTKEGFARAFDELSTKIGPDDVFVLFFAGHGVTNDKDGEYYFLPVNFRYNGAQSIVDQGISKKDILANIVKIPAQKSLLFFDTCNSGSFLDVPASRGISEKTAVDRLMRGVGRAMIMASASDQVALEGFENHGVFTYALLQALGGAADADKNGFITIKELSAYVESSVPDLTYGKWGYEQVPQSNLPQQDFPVAGNGL